MSYKKSSNKFFNEADYSTTKFLESFKKLMKLLLNFGLTEFEAKIFIFLGKYGTKTANEIKNSLNIPRSEAYRILNRLQSKGIINASFKQPMTYTALFPKQAIEIILEQEMQRIKELKILQKEFLEMWDDMPEFKLEEKVKKENKFQILQGIKQINNKIRKVASDSKKEFLILGSKNDFIRLYHENVLDDLFKLKVNIKILCSNLENMKHVFEGINKNNIRLILGDTTKQQCFVIGDRKEIVFFMNETNKKEDLLATWTDSDSMINSLSMLFDLMWNHAEETSRSKKQSKIKELEDASKFRLKELQQEMIIAESLNQLLNQKIKKSKS